MYNYIIKEDIKTSEVYEQKVFIFDIFCTVKG